MRAWKGSNEGTYPSGRHAQQILDDIAFRFLLHGDTVSGSRGAATQGVASAADAAVARSDDLLSRGVQPPVREQPWGREAVARSLTSDRCPPLQAATAA
jgi:hypothetical protein